MISPASQSGLTRAMILMPELVLLAGAAVAAALTAFQRRLLYFPGHGDVPTQMREWEVDGRTVGRARVVAGGETIWLLLHGNAGQAANRDYVLSCLSPRDSLYVMEYPGYGRRPGKPGRESMDRAAAAAYRWLRAAHPGVPVGVMGESIGSGPACALAGEPEPPDRIVLLVPFDRLADVAGDHLPWLPVRWLLFDRWDNGAALQGYRGRLEIFGAADDEVIPIRHARALAASVPQAVFHEVPGGHNDWSAAGRALIGN